MCWPIQNGLHLSAAPADRCIFNILLILKYEIFRGDLKYLNVNAYVTKCVCFQKPLHLVSMWATSEYISTSLHNHKLVANCNM